ncbi:SDR family NAD(P)-dependent oxidoreductase [Nocardioides anomalus]|uniref:SDR family NAD(P)-dependent oxidoreductase n=1 Tax=Nocardioides anomalus TaxID=2712223 RepID=A0A6G6WCK4_9ACTN|nr:oxidoreductase [Nocardioides anomalus]QIG42770.1 SDR family NAD(P)-dependent oxidoreductase [Nocardioides anomalus]
MSRVWFITGAARGLGREVALHALAAGDDVVATSRAGDAGLADHGPGRLLEVALDVTDDRQVDAAVRAAVQRFDRIDVLVNSAGHGLLGAVEETSDDEVRAVFETNLFGLLAVTRAVLPGMRARRSGHVVNIGSMGGFAQVAGWGVYGATKFALEGVSEALQAELAPLGIRVTVVEPGGFRTGFLDAVRTAAVELDDYADSSGAVRRAVRTGSVQQAGDPARAAAALHTALMSPEPPFRLQLGADAVEMVEDKLDRVRAELERWRELAASTAGPPS